jgi:YjbE family integral membrane protein
LRIALATVALELLSIVGLTLAGGILLLWVAWKLFRELRPKGRREPEAHAVRAPAKTFRQALFQVVAADVSMSLDNVLAVAGTAREHFWVLVVGLLLSVALMGVASSLVARLLVRYRWIAWIGLAIVAFVALRLIYDGSTEVIERATALARLHSRGT